MEEDALAHGTWFKVVWSSGISCREATFPSRLLGAAPQAPFLKLDR